MLDHREAKHPMSYVWRKKGLKVTEFRIQGPMHLEFEVHLDKRGGFVEFFNSELFHSLDLPEMFPQANTSFTWQGVIRGMHIQKKQPQGKLIQVVSGCIQDVAVDLRRDSPTFGQKLSLTLRDLSPGFAEFFWVPPGFAHGFLAIQNSQVNYLCSTRYEPESDGGVHPLRSGIEWNTSQPAQISEKDNQLPSLVDYMKASG